MEKIQKNISSVYVSVDASSADTYRIVRRGGEFHNLLPNLEFLGRLRKDNKIDYLQLDFVVQKENFLDMPGFVELGKKLGVDHVFFQKIINWGTFSEDEFLNHAIWMPEHPQHRSFKEILKQRIFNDNIVKRGNLAEFLDVSKLQKLRQMVAKIKPLRHAYIKTRQFFHVPNQ